MADTENSVYAAYGRDEHERETLRRTAPRIELRYDEVYVDGSLRYLLTTTRNKRTLVYVQGDSNVWEYPTRREALDAILWYEDATQWN